MFEFSADAYVMRYGWQAAARAAVYLFVAAVFIVQDVRTPHGDFDLWSIFILAFLLVLAGYAVADLRRAVSRAVVVAVDQAGIYFGANGMPELVPWDQICSVE